MEPIMIDALLIGGEGDGTVVRVEINQRNVTTGAITEEFVVERNYRRVDFNHPRLVPLSDEMVMFVPDYIPSSIEHQHCIIELQKCYAANVEAPGFDDAPTS